MTPAVNVEIRYINENETRLIYYIEFIDKKWQHLTISIVQQVVRKYR